MNTRLQGAVALAMAAAVSGAQAQSPESVEQLEEVIVTGQLSRYSATKSDTPIMETARSISIETRQQIIDKGALALDDTFTYSAGVIGKTYGYATRGDWVKVRGLDVPQYQDSLQSLFGNYNNARPDIYTVEQVEILKGPASVLYGKGSPGGIINVVSKRPQEQARHELSVESGNLDRKQVGLDTTGQIDEQGEWLYRLVAVYRDSDTQVDYVDEKTTVLAPSITWRPNVDTNLTFLMNYQQTEGDTAAQFLPISGTLESAANGEHIDTSTYLGEPGFNNYDAKTSSFTLLADHQINATWSAELTARYTDGEVDYQQAWPAFIGGDRYVYNEDGSLYKDGTVPRTFYRNDSTSEQRAIDGRLRASFDTGRWQHEVLMGAQYQDVTTDSAGYYAFALGYGFAPGEPAGPLGDSYWINVFNPQYGNIPPAELLDALYSESPETNSTDLGLYINDQISLDDWHITLGLRYDETKTDTSVEKQKDDAFSGSVGVLYQFANGVAPYLNYAESFEPVIGDNGNGQALDPQEGKQLEAGIKYQPGGFPGLVTVAYFDIEQTNLPDPSASPGGFEQQKGKATITGVELEAVANLGDFTVELNLSKLDTESPYGMRLASVPEEQASSWVSYRPQGRWSGMKGGLGVRYVGASFGGLDRIKTPSYTLGDLMLGYEMAQWDFTVNVRNLGDEDYYATCLARGDCFPGEGRTVVGQVRYAF